MTPMELDKRDFKKAVRGYSEEEVDFFLAKVRADYESLYKDNQDIKAQLDDYEQNVGKYKALEHTLNNTLIVAQQTAEDLKRNAEKAAELILEEAKLKAQQRVHAAEAEVRKLGLQKEELLKRIQELKIRLRAFLRAQLDLLEDNKELDEVINAQQEKADAKIAAATSETAADEQPVQAAEAEAAQSEVSASEASLTEVSAPEVTQAANEPINYSWTRDDEPQEESEKKEE